VVAWRNDYHNTYRWT